MQTQQLILLMSLFFCHFLADYTHLSTDWMLRAKRFGEPLIPIFIHALVHACLMGVTLEIYCHYTIEGYETTFFSLTHVDKLFFFQLVTHFLIDFWKGKMHFWFPKLSVPSSKGHWVLAGFDQFLHAVVIITMVYFMK